MNIYYPHIRLKSLKKIIGMMDNDEEDETSKKNHRPLAGHRHTSHYKVMSGLKLGNVPVIERLKQAVRNPGQSSMVCHLCNAKTRDWGKSLGSSNGYQRTAVDLRDTVLHMFNRFHKCKHRRIEPLFAYRKMMSESLDILKALYKRLNRYCR